MTTEAARIWGRRRRLRRHNDGPDELTTMTEASVDEYEPKLLTTTMDSLTEEAEVMTLIQVFIQCRQDPSAG